MLIKTVVDSEQVKQSQNIIVKEADTVILDTKSNEMYFTDLAMYSFNTVGCTMCSV